jgi:hypothetical protein
VSWPPRRLAATLAGASRRRLSRAGLAGASRGRLSRAGLAGALRRPPSRVGLCWDRRRATERALGRCRRGWREARSGAGGPVQRPKSPPSRQDPGYKHPPHAHVPGTARSGVISGLVHRPDQRAGQAWSRRSRRPATRIALVVDHPVRRRPSGSSSTIRFRRWPSGSAGGLAGATAAPYSPAFVRRVCDPAWPLRGVPARRRNPQRRALAADGAPRRRPYARARSTKIRSTVRIANARSARAHPAG